MNKRGFELAISTIVIIIISLAVLTFLALSFTKAGETFMSSIKSYFSYSNVDSVIKRCNILVDSGSSYSYCCENVSVKYYKNGNKIEEMKNCNDLSELEIGNEINKMECNINC